MQLFLLSEISMVQWRLVTMENKANYFGLKLNFSNTTLKYIKKKAMNVIAV